MVVVSDFIDSLKEKPEALFLSPVEDADFDDPKIDWYSAWGDKSISEIDYIDEHYEIAYPEDGVGFWSGKTDGEIFIKPIC